MKKLITVALSLMLMVGLSGLVVAGSLDSPGAPSAGSGMYTLQNLYDYLTSGAALTVQASFQEPTSGPGSTMKTTKEIGDSIKALYNQCDVTAANVEQGKKFFCTQPGSWGVQTGTAQLVPTPTPSPTITPTITPTPTPTWNQAACEAKGGWWGRDGLGSNGCWFIDTSANTSCTATCAKGDRGLTCDTRAWEDLPGCDACHALVAGSSGCSQHSLSGPPILAAGNGCYYRAAGNPAASCDFVPAPNDWRRLCVCK